MTINKATIDPTLENDLLLLCDLLLLAELIFHGLGEARHIVTCHVERDTWQHVRELQRAHEREHGLGEVLALRLDLQLLLYVI